MKYTSKISLEDISEAKLELIERIHLLQWKSHYSEIAESYALAIRPYCEIPCEHIVIDIRYNHSEVIPFADQLKK